MSTTTMRQRYVVTNVHNEQVLERVHPHTLVLIQKMLSTKQFNSIQFIAHLLRLAEVKQQSIFPATEETAHRAIIHIQSVQELSQRPGWPWGYTTTYKVLRVLEALGLLQRKPGELHFLYGAPQLHSDILLNLQKLQASKTPKVQQLAKKVRWRLERDVLCGSQGKLEGISSASNSPVDQTTQTITALLQQEGITISPQLATRLYATCQEVVKAFAQLLVSVAQPETLASKEIPWFSFEEGLIAEKGTQAGNSLGVEGNSPLAKERHEKRGERNLLQEEGNSLAALVTCSPLPKRNDMPEFPMSQEEGNVRDIKEQEKLCSNIPSLQSNSPSEDVNSPVEQEKGNSLTLNVSSKYNNNYINNNVKDSPDSSQEHVSQTNQAYIVFAYAIEGHQRNLANYRAYINRFGYKTVLAAFLYLEQQRISSCSRIKSPGKYYNSIVKAWGELGTYEQACRAYNLAYAEGRTIKIPGIPWDIQRLVAQFEQWPLEAFVKELRLHPDILLVTQEPSSGLQANEENFEERKEAIWDQEQVIGPHTPSQWMGYEEAIALLAQVQSQAAEIEITMGLTCIKIAPVPRAYHIRGTHMEAYVIDVTIEGIPVTFASASQWKLYYLEQTDLNAYKVFRQQMEAEAGYP